MEFKIDTKDTFSIITPVAGEINANLTGELRKKCAEMRQSGRKNFIVDLYQCQILDKSVVEELVDMHEECYGMEESLVFTGITAGVMSVLKEGETDLLINVAPKMAEAIDIISMEILERDLFKEE